MQHTLTYSNTKKAQCCNLQVLQFPDSISLGSMYRTYPGARKGGGVGTLGVDFIRLVGQIQRLLATLGLFQIKAFMHMVQTSIDGAWSTCSSNEIARGCSLSSVK